MLFRFGVSNFRSINERQELSMIADSKIKDLNEGVIEVDSPSLKERVLPAALIYGANASGKTSLVEAFKAMCEFISFSASPDYIKEIYQPFRLDNEAKDKASSFDVDFIVDNVRYHYGFSIDNEKVIEEWLYAFPKGRKVQLYERNFFLEKINFGNSIGKKPRDIENRTRKDVLFITTAYQLNYTDFANLWIWFNFMSFQCINSDWTTGVIPKDIFNPAIMPFLTDIGTGIVEYRFTDFIYPWRRNSGRKFDDSVHLITQFGHKNKNGNIEFFDLELESLGTRRVITILPIALKALEYGTPFFIDELDASLHTKLAEKLIQLFQNKETNPKGAQLIATTHDTNLMSSAHLRRDQIWFTEKNPEQATQLYPLTDFNTRKEGNIEKGYLDGRYGAIPYGGSIAALFSK